MKIELTIENYNLDFFLSDDNDNQLRYEELTREDQIKIINAFAQGYEFFKRFLKEE